MSWSDIFYPGNPGRREEVVRMLTKLSTLMEFNFDATNDLSDMVNTHLNPSPPLQHISVDSQATIKTNSETIINQIERIETSVDRVDEELASTLDPSLYRELNDPGVGFRDKVAIAKKAVTSTISIVATAAGVAVVAAIKAGAILKSIVTAIGVIKASAAASIVIGVIALGIDMIASAIIGSVERGKLDSVIDDLKKALKTFDPASKLYTKTITKVEIRLTIYFNE